MKKKKKHKFKQMKAKSLQFGKAMSAALFVLLLSVAGMKNALAQTQVATLQHGDDISVFYGTNAFVEAHTAAADGDIVTLSSGSFMVPPQITKAITLRGAGVVSDTVAGTAPTVFGGTVTLYVANDSIPFQMEGILVSNIMYYGKLTNPKFTRCSFNNISAYTANIWMTNAQFVNCMIRTFVFSSASNTTLINSVVWEPSGISSSAVTVLYNSVFRNANLTNGGLMAYNSIIVRENVSNVPNASCTFFNCIGLQLGHYSVFGTGYISGCIIKTTCEDVFETFTGTFSLEESFILKDEIATGFLGSDGTQVGIHGGFMPYSNRPSYMVLKRCNVANKSTIDGKLSVEIEVVTEE